MQPSNEDYWGCPLKTFRAPFSLFFYLVARCFQTSKEEGCWWWWWWRSPRQRSPQWQHDPITGLCNWSEPHSALYNSIRSACCSQLGPGTTTVTVTHNNVGQITTLGKHPLFRAGLSVCRECHGGARVSASLRPMSLVTKCSVRHTYTSRPERNWTNDRLLT